MSKILCPILLLAILIAFSWAMICIPNFCNAVKCQEDITEENCQFQNGIFIPNGSLCGCCPVCVVIPNMEGDSPGERRVKLYRYPIMGDEEQGFYYLS